MTKQTIGRTVPGAAVHTEIQLRDGHRLAVLTRRDGGREMTVGSCTVRLDEAESDALAQLLGSGGIITRLDRLRHDVDALLTEQLPLPGHSPYAGRSLADTKIRGRTGASIVAVIREGTAQPSPRPDYVLVAGDLVVAVGTREALDQAGRILDGTG